ncbi:DUF5313 family protein [Thermopolyspora sp. NPDC052614]|uniref:DUF5313 family protein n=1 Tax=Thermopolyspora sp. NPDC052614 TaxID=3155682 RepID=UPI00341D0939
MINVPGPWRRIRYALGFRLPAEHQGWVWRDLTATGWRGRILGGHLAVVVMPVCAVLAFLPGEWWIRAMTVAMVVAGSVFVVSVNANVLRHHRLRRHGIEPDERWHR